MRRPYDRRPRRIKEKDRARVGLGDNPGVREPVQTKPRYPLDFEFVVWDRAAFQCSERAVSGNRP